MLVFPQLASGAIAQYPLQKTRVRRTVVNSLGDGTLVKFADDWAGTAEWSIALSALSSAETAAIADLFRATEGRLQRFTFIDPSTNLLAWSGDLTKTLWQKDPLLQVHAGAADPFGGTRAAGVVNAGQARQGILQSLPAPCNFTYCFSAWVRSAGASSVTLIRTCASSSDTTTVRLDSNWRRISSSGALIGADTSIGFAIELDPGASIELFGLQAEAQDAPSAYMETTEMNGVYSNARFNTDRLTITAQSPGRTDTELRIIAPDGI
jgi:hypothetical protein